MELELDGKVGSVMPYVKLVVLGSPGCGKTSLVHQFLFNHCPEKHEPTRRPCAYYPGIFADNQLYELRIVDTCPISVFPKSSLEDWARSGSSAGGPGVRGAHAYIVVFDVTSRESLRWAKSLRDQIQTEAADSVVLIVGNKIDELHKMGGNISSNARPNGLLQANGPGDTAVDQFRKEISSYVKKQWKCSFVECSAKWNWNVTSVFHELVILVKRNAELQGTPCRTGGPSGGANQTGHSLRKKRARFLFRRRATNSEARSS
ncbi:Ras-like protein family member 10B [Trichinella sp. T9]|nr:Ras-like protein family member 10B [Trichinella sp. T9]